MAFREYDQLKQRIVMAIPTYEQLMLPLLEILKDGMQLAQYMIEFNVGVSTEIIYEIKKVDSDYFIEE